MTEKLTYEELEKKIQELEQAESNRNKGQLSHSHDLMDYIISHARSAIAVHDRDLKYIYVSKRYLKDYKVKEQNIIGKHHYEVFPDLSQKWRDVHQRSLAGEVLSAEDDLSYKEDGSVNWTRWECRPWYESGGSIGGIVIYTEVITDRKLTEEALKESESRLLEAQKVAHIGNWAWDLQTNKLSWSKENYRIFGLSLEISPSYEAFEKAIHPEDRVFVNKSVENALKRKKSYNIEFRIILSGGKVRIVHSIGNVDYDREDKPLRFFGTVQDITERKRSEEALRKSEKKYRILFENMAQGVFYQNADGELIDYNQNALDMFGLTKDQFLGKTSLDPKWKVIHEDGSDFPSDKHPSMVALKTGEPVFDAIAGIFNPRKKEFVWLNINAIPQFKNGNSKPYQVFVTLHDISDLRKAEKELRQAQKIESIGTLAGGIAHDFNNILGSIIGYSELLKEDMIGNETSKHFIDQILKGGNRAKELVKQILLFSRQSEHDKIQVEITPLVKEMKKMLTASLPSTIEFKMNILTTHDFVLADPTQIHQVLMNLCTNSAHAMEKKGGTLTIEIDQMNMDQDALKKFPDLKVGNYLKLQISDTGHGIPPDVMDKIFDPFFSTKSRGEGTGLGLSVVHGIVKKCSGDIKAYSELGIGTTFIVLLPMIDIIEQKKSTENNFIPKGKEKILFVDDEQPLVDLGKMMLERLGYKVTAISDSQEAWYVFRKDPNAFDMVITDKTMPGLTGLGLSKKVLALCPEMPIIMCTGFGDEYSIEQAKKIGIRDYIRKPILKIKLAETIQNIFDQPDEGEV